MKTSTTTVFTIAIGISDVLAQPPGTISPLVQSCGPSSAIACVNKYAAVMPYHFYRQASTNGSYQDTYASTSVPNDTSFGLVSQADFLVFDQRGLDLLGGAPSYEYVFAVNDGEFIG
jgi:hypothetical protein